MTDLHSDSSREMLESSGSNLQGQAFQPMSLKSFQQDITDSVVAVFPDHQSAETAIKTLAQDGFAMNHLSVIGKGYHSEEKVVGFYNMGDRISFWGGRGAFWGGLWGLFFGGLFLTTPVIGPVIVLGFLTSTLIAGLESAIIVGGVSALGAALYSIGIPHDSVVHYEADLKADRFVVMVRGSSDDMSRAKTILGTIKPARLDHYNDAKTARDPSSHPLKAGL